MVGDDTIGEVTGDRAARRLVGGLGAGLELALADAVDEDLVLAQIAAGEVLVVGPELLAEF